MDSDSRAARVRDGTEPDKRELGQGVVHGTYRVTHLDNRNVSTRDGHKGNRLVLSLQLSSQVHQTPVAVITDLTHIQRSSEAVLLSSLSLNTAPPSPNNTFRRKQETSQQYIDKKEKQYQPNRTDTD